MANTKDDPKAPKLSPRAQRALDQISDEEDRQITKAAESDPDNPIWTDEDWERARPAREVVPQIVADYERRQRGKQKAPTKERITVRLDRDIVEHFRGSGRGWQSRMNEALRDAMKRLKRAS